MKARSLGSLLILGLATSVGCVVFGADDPASPSPSSDPPDAGFGPVTGEPAEGTIVFEPIGPLTLVQGSETDLRVVLRRGRGVPEISLAVEAALPGVSGPPLLLPAGVSEGVVHLVTGSDVTQGPSSLSVVATTRATELLAPLSFRTKVELRVRGQPGSVDTTFGDHGFVSDVYGADLEPAALALAPGAIVAIAASSVGSGSTKAARLSADGVLDKTYGSAGVATLDLTVPTGAALRPDGKLLVISTNAAGAGLLDAAGLPDATFGDQAFGFGTTRLDNAFSAVGGSPMAFGVTLDPTGRALVAASVRNGVDDFVSIGRVTAAGVADATFGRFGGSGVTDVVGPASLVGLALDAAGNVLGAGVVEGSGLVLFGFNPAGKLLSTYGTGGTTRIARSDAVGSPAGVVVMGDGRLVVPFSTPAGVFLAMASPNGKTLDSTFGGGVVGPLGAASSTPAHIGVSLDPKGTKLVIALRQAEGTVQSVARIGLNGSLDATFGAGGVATVPLPSGVRGFASRIAVQPDGRVVVLGQRHGAGLTGHTTLARLWN